MSAAADVIPPQNGGIESRGHLKDVTFLELNDGKHATSSKTNNDISSSGDEYNLKIRKPYTLTKQRERWTEDEHERFLEALKLYGRSWRQIEEHIGTKTAVQIRSHAQKFFTKLEREASNTSSDGKIQDIHIPPPRPKRKPNHPYPRKARDGSPALEKIREPNLFANGYSLPANVKWDICNTNTHLKMEDRKTCPGNKRKVCSSQSGQAEDSPASFEKNGGSAVLNPVPNHFIHANPAAFSACKDGNAARQVKFHPLGSHGYGSNGGVSNQTMNHEDANEGTDESNVEASSTEDKPCRSSDVSRLQKFGGKAENLISHLEEKYSKANIEERSEGHHSTGDQNNPTDTWMNGIPQYYHKLPNPSNVPFAACTGHPAYSSAAWNFFQTSMMNHPAAVAAALAATKWMMEGANLTPPYNAQNQNPIQPNFPDDQSIAAFSAAAAASWWMFGGLMHPPFGFQPPNFGSTDNRNNATTGKDKTQTSVPSFMDARTVRPSTQNVQGHINISEDDGSCQKTNMKKSHAPTTRPPANVGNKESDTGEKTMRNTFTSIEECDGEGKPREGSSSGSNTPTFRSPSSGPETPNLSDVKEDETPCKVEDETVDASEALNGTDCFKKSKYVDKSKHQHKEFRHGDNEYGKRFKGFIHDADSRKEVSQEGRKAFDALFMYKTLPQTFCKATTGMQSSLLKERVASQNSARAVMTSESMVIEDIGIEKTNSAGGATNSLTTDGNTNANLDNSNIANIEMVEHSKVVNIRPDIPNTQRKAISCSTNQRSSRSGFVPYQKPPAESNPQL